MTDYMSPDRQHRLALPRNDEDPYQIGPSALRDPTPEDLASPEFKAVWQAIKGWDIQRTPGAGYAHATGTDVCTILDALRPQPGA